MRPIYRTGVPLPSRQPILYIFSTNTSTEYFKLSVFPPAKCHLFDNAAFFVSCIIHILRTGYPKIEMPNSGDKRLIYSRQNTTNLANSYL